MIKSKNEKRVRPYVKKNSRSKDIHLNGGAFEKPFDKFRSRSDDRDNRSDKRSVRVKVRSGNGFAVGRGSSREDGHALKHASAIEAINKQIVDVREKLETVQSRSIENKIESCFNSFSEKMDTKLDSFEQKLDIKFDSFEQKMDAKLDSLEQKMDIKLEAFEKRTDIKFDAVNEKMDIKFAEVDKRFEQVDKRFEEVDQKIDSKFGTRVQFVSSIIVIAALHIPYLLKFIFDLYKSPPLGG